MKFLIGALLIFGMMISVIGFWCGTEHPGLFVRGSAYQYFTFMIGTSYITFTSAATAILINKNYK